MRCGGGTTSVASWRSSTGAEKRIRENQHQPRHGPIRVLVIAAFPAMAQSNDMSPVGTLLQGVLNAITGPLGIVMPESAGGGSRPGRGLWRAHPGAGFAPGARSVAKPGRSRRFISVSGKSGLVRRRAAA